MFHQCKVIDATTAGRFRAWRQKLADGEAKKRLRAGGNYPTDGDLHPLRLCEKSNTSCSARRSSRGYSRLIGADEEGTLGHLRALCREFANPKIKEQRGCFVKTAGDGLLLKSASVIDAVGLSRRRHG